MDRESCEGFPAIRGKRARPDQGDTGTPVKIIVPLTGPAAHADAPPPLSRAGSAPSSIAPQVSLDTIAPLPLSGARIKEGRDGMGRG